MKDAPSQLRVCFPFENRSVGGSYYATKLLIEHFDPQVVKSFVVTHQKGPWSRLLTEFCGDQHFELALSLPFSRAGIVRTVYDFVKCSLSLSSFLRREHIDIVHTNEDSTALAWALACRLAGKVHVWHQHAVPAASRSTRLLRNQSTVLLSASEYIGEELRSAGRAPDFKLDNPFVFEGEVGVSERLKQEKRKALGLSGEALVLVFVGSLTEQKRPRQAIEVLAQLQRLAGRTVGLKMFGDDRYGMMKDLESYASELGVAENLEFMGVHTSLSSYYQAADFLLSPAIQEGFGRVLVEAMYYGCCVVAADSGGHREVIESGKNGFLVKPDSSQDMVSAVLSCMSNPAERKRIIQNAKNDAQKRCDNKVQLIKLMDIYREILNK